MKAEIVKAIILYRKTGIPFEEAAIGSSRMEMIALPYEEFRKLVKAASTRTSVPVTIANETVGCARISLVKLGTPFRPAAPPVMPLRLVMTTRMISPKPRVTIAR